ncbi:MAG: hypothetical protein WC628_09430 [Candidatus Omnitrophota bacterium]
MANYRLRIEAEYEAIDKTVSSLPSSPLINLSLDLLPEKIEPLAGGASDIFAKLRKEIDKLTFPSLPPKTVR